MKRRRRTNSNVPAKGRLRDLADQLWSVAVRRQWKNRCAVCGSGKVEAHHLVPRQHEATRYDVEHNGISLCGHCHQFDRDLSPHQNAAGWMQWLGTHHRELLAWYVANPRPQFIGTKTPAYYCEQIKKLREHVPAEDFQRIVGKKFSAYLLEQTDGNGLPSK